MVQTALLIGKTKSQKLYQSNKINKDHTCRDWYDSVACRTIQLSHFTIINFCYEGIHSKQKTIKVKEFAYNYIKAFQK